MKALIKVCFELSSLMEHLSFKIETETKWTELNLNVVLVLILKQQH